MFDTAFLTTPDLNLAATPDVPRFVVGIDGRVAYASDSLAQMLRTVPDVLVGCQLQDIIVFADPSAAFRDQPFAMMTDDDGAYDWCSTIEPGRHTVHLRDFPDQRLGFDFEWMQVGSGARYLVATSATAALTPAPLDDVSVIYAAPMAFMPVYDIPDQDINDLPPQTPFSSALRALASVVPVNDDEPLVLEPEPVAVVVAAPAPTPVMPAPMMRVPYIPNGPAPSAREAFRKVLERGARSEGQVFLDLSDDIMLRTDIQGRLHNANRAFFGILGYAPESIAILNFMDLVADDERAHIRTVFMGLTHDQGAGAKVNFETHLIGFDKKQYTMDVRLKRQGEKVFILCRNLTATREHEARLTRQQQQLREAESIAHMGYWRWTIGNQTVSWSDEIYRIFGVDQGQFAPTIDAIGAYVNRRDMGRIMQAFERAMIGENAFNIDFRINRPTGEMRYIKCEGRSERDASGEVIALFGIMHDVTEQTIAERDLMAAKNAAERAYASKSKFLANMSHELRTPLNAIIGFSEMMQRQLLGPIGTEKYLDYIDGIRASGEHLLDLISDILDMSKIEAGKYTLDVEDLNIAKLTRLALNMVEARAQDAGIALTCGTFNDDIRVVADRRATLQMMLNLLSNAIKFTEPGGSVTIDLKETEKFVSFAVRDTGIGIPADMLHVIATPFEQAANHYTRSHDGSGLGLAITKELVEMHDGDLKIESQVGVGTTVTITMPKMAKN